MSYELNAEGINGVQQTTVIAVNVIGGGWFEPPPSPSPPNSNVLLFVQAGPLASSLTNLAALQCAGNGVGPGVIGQATGPFVGGVGVAGLSQLNPDPADAFSLVVTKTAGVFGQCDGGPGVMGQGGDAQNPPIEGDLISTPISAGTGVIGRGGKLADPAKNPVPGATPATFPAVPAGAGVIGAGGGAAIPDPAFPAVGVVGIGSPAPAKLKGDPGVGVVGVGGHDPFSFDYVAFPNAGVMGQGGNASTSDTPAAGGTGVTAGIGVIGWGGGSALKSSRGKTAPEEQTETAGAGVVGIAGDSVMPSPPSPPASTAGVVGIGSRAQPTLETPLAGGAGVLGMGSLAAFPTGEVVTNGPGVVGIGAPNQPIVGAGRGGVFGNVDVKSNVAQIQLLPSLLNPPLPEFGSFGDLYLTLNPNPGSTGYAVLMFLCVRQNLPSSPGLPAQWAPFILGSIQNGGVAPKYP